MRVDLLLLAVARWAALAVAGCASAASAQPAVVTTEHVRAELLAHAPEGIAPGKPMWLGLAIRHQPGWHTYWKNPGDSGLATTLVWQLPEGAQAGAIAWPTPKQLPVGPLVNYGYEDELLLPVPLLVAAPLTAADVTIRLRADWLVCKELCIPESGEFTLTLPRDAATGLHAARFADAQARVPAAPVQAVARGRVDGSTLRVEVEGLPASLRGQELRFFAETAGVIEYAAALPQRWDGERWSAEVALSAQRSASPATMPVVLTGADGAGVQLRFDIAGPWPGAATSTASPSAPALAPTPTTAVAPLPAPPATAADVGAQPASTAESGPLLLSIGLALLGGLLLNLMPCVFPILSLKVMAFARPGQSRRALMAAGLAYTAGVIASFLALAAILLALRAGGEQIGWGFQLQSPGFIAALAVLFTLIGLNLAGVFEMRMLLPSRLACLQARHPLVDHALTGALAVAVASPCTGPFMGVALGTTLVLPAHEALLVFAALGLGMALPYLALSAWPGLACRLPRPGAWMARFKGLMAFPMFATVVWLVWVLGRQAGIDGAAALLAVLVGVGFAAWTIGAPGFGRRSRTGFVTAAVLVLAATLAWAWPSLREGPDSQETARPLAAEGRWQPWSVAAVERARADGRAVFIDFTAAWCVTCQFVKRTTLSNAALLADLDARGVVLLRADWTRRDPAITQALARLGRSGVPAYAFYSSGAERPVLLPEFLKVADVRRALAGPQAGL